MTARRSTWPHDLRTSIAFFTRLPVGDVGSRPIRAGSVVLLAPVSGLVLAAAAIAAASLVVLVADGPGSLLLAAAAAVCVEAYLTRGLHLDGLADLADGLGANASPEASRAILHRSDIGPFGVVALVLVLLLQTAALVLLGGVGAMWLGLLVALPAGRLAAAWLCRRGVPAAPGSTLGSWVAGTVSARAAAAAVLAVVLGGAAAGWLWSSQASVALACAGAILAALLGASILGRTALRRLGGITGDVLGAAVEVGQTAALLLLALALG